MVGQWTIIVLMMFDVLLNDWSIGPWSIASPAFHYQPMTQHPKKGWYQRSDAAKQRPDVSGTKILTFDLAERRGYPLEMGVLMGWSINNRVCSWESLWMGYVNVYIYMMCTFCKFFIRSLPWRIKFITRESRWFSYETWPWNPWPCWRRRKWALRSSQHSGMGLPSQHS